MCFQIPTLTRVLRNRYCSQAIDSVPIQLCATRKIVTSALINHLAWSPWRPFAAKSGALKCSGLVKLHTKYLLVFLDAASLAASSSDGSVLLITITQHIAPTDVNTSLYTQHQLTLLVEDEETLVCEPDGRTITCLSWIILSGGHVRVILELTIPAIYGADEATRVFSRQSCSLGNRECSVCGPRQLMVYHGPASALYISSSKRRSPIHLCSTQSQVSAPLPTWTPSW